jgi:peptidylprolyl isomerase
MLASAIQGRERVAMGITFIRSFAVATLLVWSGVGGASETPGTAEVMAGLSPSDWRQPDPANLVYLRLENGTVVMELAPSFAPNSIANIRALIRERYYDGLAIVRSHDNYVVQWADAAADEKGEKPVKTAKREIDAEFQRPLTGVEIATIQSADAYANIAGFADGFPAASDGVSAWLTHCYGMVGVARGNESNSGDGTSLYVIIGHAPRHLDRNVTLIGRVISGIELLSILPRGTGDLGFYETADEYTTILDVRLGTEVPDEQRLAVEIMRTDTKAFADYVVSRTYRHEEWFVEPTGRIEVCNITPPIRPVDEDL